MFTMETLILFLFCGFFIFVYFIFQKIMKIFLEWRDYDYIQKIFPNLFWRFHRKIEDYFNKIKKAEIGESSHFSLRDLDYYLNHYLISGSDIIGEVGGWYGIYNKLSDKYQANAEAVKEINTFYKKTEDFLMEMQKQYHLNVAEASFLAYYIWDLYKDLDCRPLHSHGIFEGEVDEIMENLKSSFINLKR